MVRGCQKKIYYMKNPESKYFEEVYLILRKDIAENQREPVSADLAKEAERIVRDANRQFSPPKKAPFIGRITAFALGVASSSLVIGAVALIIGLG